MQGTPKTKTLNLYNVENLFLLLNVRASHALYTRVCVLCCCVQVSIPAWHSTLLSMLTVLCG